MRAQTLGTRQSAAAALGLESLDFDSEDFESDELEPESEPESEPFDSFDPSEPAPPFFFLP